ncbi:uncharacterized protein LOC131937912 [Physella acuta]|uniref:uncharacterized protein LOC131937912 n=1 Tax=Physella acuta TaxID=109671 RepID=UPI0027DAC092|nr:uncharacterized protein LOC131937912 [Physella acuta]XP_059151625.1 uncharacterized protein LOC131937912 [Physella acuta]
MAASKLYPTLSSFYNKSYIDFGSEADMLAGVPADRLYRKPRDELRANRDNSEAKKDLSSNKTFPADGAQSLELELQTADSACLPSAPPLEWSDEDIERFLEDVAQQQELALQHDLDPDGFWVDDLQPDYDMTPEVTPETTPETTPAEHLNNLNKAETPAGQSAKDHSLLVNNILATPQGSPRGERSRRVVQTRRSDPHKRHVTNIPRAVEHRPASSSRKPDVSHDKENHAGSSENLSRPATPGSPDPREPRAEGAVTPGSPEYNAWMTWRKQVNRQLATVILLKRNGQVHVQKKDMARRPLSQSSIDFVSLFKAENKTSLGGKPFLMYGIPRVSLPSNQ